MCKPFCLVMLCALSFVSCTPSATPSAPASENTQIQSLFLSSLRQSCEKSDVGSQIDKTRLCNCTVREYETRLKTEPALATDSDEQRTAEVATEVGTKCGLESVKSSE